MLIPPKTYHQILPLTEGASRITLFVEMMLPDYKCDKSDIRFYKAFQQEDFSIFNTEATEIRQVLVYIKNILESEMNYLKREKMRVFATILLINIFEQLFPDNNTKMTIKSSELPPPEETLNNFFAFSFMSNSSHKDLANKLHVSPRQLHRIMKKTYNINYRQKLKEVRLEIAINFLRNTDNSIAEISNILGYSNSANFSTFIKTSTGKTPSQIRKENQTLGNITCHRQI